MINPKKLRFRLIIIIFFVMIFIIGFLKNHVFAAYCNTAPFSQFNYTYHICNGVESGNRIYAYVNEDFLSNHTNQSLPHISLCTDSLSHQTALVFDRKIDESSLITTSSFGSNCPSPASVVCDSYSHQTQCLFSGSAWHILDGNGQGLCGTWGMYAPCDGGSYSNCDYQNCGDGKYLNTLVSVNAKIFVILLNKVGVSHKVFPVMMIVSVFVLQVVILKVMIV